MAKTLLPLNASGVPESDVYKPNFCTYGELTEMPLAVPNHMTPAASSIKAVTTSSLSEVVGCGA